MTRRDAYRLADTVTAWALSFLLAGVFAGAVLGAGVLAMVRAP